MKKNGLMIGAVFAVALLVIYGFGGSEGEAGDNWQTEINWSSAEISLEELTAGQKPVFLFVTTDWCHYCKKMKSETFSDGRVQQILNDKFVNVVINPEKNGTVGFAGKISDKSRLSFREMATKLGVTGYPASFFLSPEGDVIGGQPGYLSAGQLADLAMYIGGGFYKNYKFNEFMNLPAEQKN